MWSFILKPSELVSSFGGLMGIFFGMSVISRVECLFCVYEVVQILLIKLRHNKVGTGQDEPEDEQKERKNILMSEVQGLRCVDSTKNAMFCGLFWLLFMSASTVGLFLEISSLPENYDDCQTYVDIAVK